MFIYQKKKKLQRKKKSQYFKQELHDIRNRGKYLTLICNSIFRLFFYIY